MYCPVDVYGRAAEIDADIERLRLCDQIVVHSPRLRPYFQSYAATSVFDHHLKYVIPTRAQRISDGPIVWVGVRSNLPPLVDVNRYGLPAELVVLTNPEYGDDLDDPTRFGFLPQVAIRAERWSPDRHLHWLVHCRAAIDMKAQDFRARHKSAAKALDPGLRCAVGDENNSESVAYILTLGFEIADPRNSARWLSAEYAQESTEFGRRICIQLAAPVIMERWRSLLVDVFERRPSLAGRPVASIRGSPFKGAATRAVPDDSPSSACCSTARQRAEGRFIRQKPRIFCHGLATKYGTS